MQSGNEQLKLLMYINHIQTAEGKRMDVYRKRVLAE